MFNLNDGELQAITNLRQNKSIIVCKPDKGNGVVLLNKSDYVTSQTKINQSAWLRNQTRSWSCNIDILYFETQKLLPISSASTHNLIHRISNREVQIEFGPALCQNGPGDQATG